MSRFSAQRPSQLEPWVFGALMVLHAIPVLAFPWFPTLDGPAHLYNARIIGSLLGGDVTTARFFELNPFPEPNWLGHAIMAGVMTIASAQAAEKVVILLHVIGLPLSFRFALLRLGSRNAWAALLIFPFIYCFTFRIGFLNFSLGLPLLLLAVGTGARLSPSPDKRSLMWIALLLTVLYFAHLACFLLAVGFLFGLALRKTGADRDADGTRWWHALLANLKAPLLAASPGLLLCAAFFFSHQDERAQLGHLPFSDLLAGLLNGRPFVALSEAEEPYARTITWAMAAMTVAVMTIALRGPKLHSLERTWLLAGVAVLVVAYFVLPDQMATGGFISVRLLLFAYLLWALWLGLQELPRWLNAALLGITVAAELLVLRVHYEYTKGLNAELAEVLSVAPFLPEHAVLVPLNYSGNWMHSNFPCYLGATRNVDVLDNFGARTPHMPVRWKDDTDPSGAVGTFTTSDRPCVDLNASGASGTPLVDHVLTWKLRNDINDSCTNDVRAQLQASFIEVAVSPLGDAHLYRRR
jgi:hypothetical protein